MIYIYLQSAGDIYVDDLNLVAGSVPDAGVNLITNAGFETSLTGTWNTTANFASMGSTTVTNLASETGNKTGFGSVNGVRNARQLQLMTRFSF